MRLARSGSLNRSSATNLVAVMPVPSPAKVPIMPMVLWIMASSPNPAFPRKRATMTMVAKPKSRAPTVPMRLQKVPRAKRRV